MPVYYITHEHRHGTDTIHFSSKLEMDQLPPLEELVKLLGIDFEDRWDENIVLDEVESVDLDRLIDDERDQLLTDEKREGNQ